MKIQKEDAMTNRTMCDVLQEMRKLNKTRNYSALAGLIEEAQILGNRMEAAVYDKHDVEHYNKERRRLKAELKKLKDTKDALELEISELGGDDG
jgi:cell division protein FtsB